MYWANKMGRKGVRLQDAYDTATVPGTIAHYLIECWLKGEDVDLSEYKAMEIEPAQTAFDNFMDWVNQVKFYAIEVEPNLVSETLKFGGTPDLIANIHGKVCVVDWKTGRTYEDLFLQLAAYGKLWEENRPSMPIEGYACLRIPKNKDVPSFHYSKWDTLPDEAWEAFEHCLALERIKPILKGLL
jgi:hypothetical protein